MGWKMRYDDLKKICKKYSLLSVETKFAKFETCLVVNLKKETIHLLPLSYIDNDTCAFPCLAFTYDLIKSVDKIDNSKLLFFSNIDNPHIKNALEKKIGKKINAKL